ncbi:MAG: hypothetical protein CXR30_10695 [Geobacter sp.]|nr:MAG: hypothetical protein CXR30_10695 [Geobacter sp.]
MCRFGRAWPVISPKITNPLSIVLDFTTAKFSLMQGKSFARARLRLPVKRMRAAGPVPHGYFCIVAIGSLAGTSGWISGGCFAEPIFARA